MRCSWPGFFRRRPIPAVEAKPQRRRFTAEYKLGILREVERAEGARRRWGDPFDGGAAGRDVASLLSYLPGLCESCFLRRILSNEPARSEVSMAGLGVRPRSPGDWFGMRGQVVGMEEARTQRIQPRPAGASRGKREIGRKGL